MDNICSELSLSAFVVIAYYYFFFFVFFFMSDQEVSCAVDIINSSTTVRDSNGGTLISAGGTYELGFFSTLNSKNRYVGIWYKAISKRTVVWVANRDNPLTDGSGWLQVTDPRIGSCLLLLNGTNGSSSIWSTNTSRNVRNPVAQLLDSGNLVVRDAHDDTPENFLWQSFDYPTDTYLPGMMLGMNFVTGLQVYIRSWKSSDDPASGYFTCHLDPTGYPQSIVKRGEQVLYSSGPWNGISFSGRRQNLQNNTFYTYTTVINKDEVFFYYDLQNKSVYSRLVINENGVGQRWVWNDQIKDWNLYVIMAPVDNCDAFNQCGPHGKCTPGDSPLCSSLDNFKPNNPQSWDGGDWSNGCIRSTPLSCNDVAFLKYSGVKLPNTHNSWFNETMTLQQCRVLCSNNCSCTAYTSLDIRNGGSGCLLWFGDLVDMRDMSPGQEVYIKLASSELDSEGKIRKILIMTVSLVVGIFLLCTSMFLYSQKIKKKSHQLSGRGRPRLNYVDNHPDEYDSKNLELPQFELSTIIKATDNFSINNKLGEGGFGPVYKALLDDGHEIAVKRLSKTSLQGVDEFKNEVICIAKLQHRNLVKLLGCCVEGAEKMLVYEYMTNKNLDIILFDPMKSKTLNWARRFNIINGIARGLMYLHQDSCLRVIHRDLKGSNILLDSDMNPKISDFGLARSFGGNETGANTSRVAGTYGYMSPEYARDGMFSVKSDVFSFGVVVLEIICGKRNRGFSHRAHPGLNLLGHGWVLYRVERSPELLDSCVGNSCHLSEVLRSIHVGLLCVQENPQDRPSMSSVVMMLSNDGVLPEAKHPGFFTEMDMLQNETSVSSTTASSANTMTITLLEAR